LKGKARLALVGVLCLAFIFSLMSAWTACSSKGPTADNPMILDYASFLPEAYPGSKPSEDFFGEIEKATGGAVKTNFHFVQGLGPGDQDYDMTVKGIADAAIVSPSYTPGVMPLWEVFNTPLVVPSAEMATKAMVQLFQTGVFNDEFKDVKMISMYNLPPYQLASNKKISTVADFAGLKIRVNGQNMSDAITNLGGVPVFTTGAEAYSDLQKGVTDAVMWPWDGIVASYHLDEICKYVTETSMFSDGMIEVMNKDTFNSLPKAAQDYINNNWADYSVSIAANFDKIAASSRAEFLAKPDKEMVTLDPAVKAQMGQLFAPIWGKFFQDMASKGQPGQQTADSLYKILTGLGVQNPFMGYAPQ
jgi:TRAP-type C4-dicarboxylate transport system substrate-binding protein